MDKYEYKLKTEQMLELMEDGAYSKAAEIADTIDWKRVRNVTILTNVSDIYEKNRDYKKSYEVLNIAYHRAEGSRKVIYRLCTLALKTGNVDEAIDYYDDFMQIAPKDPNQHILRYQILRAQRAPIEQQIEALEEFKKAEYIEEWAYELAKLYQEAGMTAECLEECDDLILWFSEGQYVYKAMELKMQYKPLTPSQQEKYDHRYEKLSSETEEMPSVVEYSEKKKEEADAGEAEEETVSKESDPIEKKSKIGNTMRLDEALQKLLHPEREEEEEKPVPEESEKEDGLEEAIDEIESVVDLDIVNEMAEKKAAGKDNNIEMNKGEKESEDAGEEQVEGQMSFEDIFSDWEEQAKTEEPAPESAAPETEKPEKSAESILPPDIQRMIDEIEGVIPTEEEPKPVQPVKKESEDTPHENMGEVTENLRIDETSEEFEDYDDVLDEEEYEELEEDFAEELDESGGEDEEEEEISEELSVEPEDWEDVSEDDAEEFYEEDEVLDEDLIEEEDEEILDEEFEETWEEEEKPDLEEEFRPNSEDSQEVDDREIPDEEEEMDILSATTPLSRKETAKMIATGKTAPLPLDEISDALSMSDTGFIVHGRYDLETQSGIGTRAGLTEEQKKLFSYFVPVRGMSEQLVDVLEQDRNCTNREGTSRTGNLLIIGNKGNGKTVLAVDVVKAIQKQRNIRQGKVAIVTGDSLNKKKISDIFNKLYGGALIIEKAGKMNEKTVARLNKAMERDTGELLIVLEEQRKPLDRLLSSNREFRRKFTSRLEVPIFINDELVTFGQTYAQENGYRIDEMGILALYSRIDSLQREDHAVTVAEVKDVMDEAIQHSQKASAKKLVKRVFGKNTDAADRILLSEKDFNI